MIFFCCGFGKECYINSYPIVVAPSRGLNSYFSMPFRKKARIELVSQHKNVIPAMLYFFAKWNRESVTVKKKDYTILDNVYGKGIYVGTYLALQTLERYWWGEGEVKFYLDGDEEFPTICGTGMEDYVGGSWSFAKEN